MSGKLPGGGRVSIKGRGRGGGGEDTRVVGVGHTGLPLKLLNGPSDVRQALGGGAQGLVPGDPRCVTWLCPYLIFKAIMASSGGPGSRSVRGHE